MRLPVSAALGVLFLLLAAAPLSQAAGPLESAALSTGAELQRIAFGSCFKAQRDGDEIWSSIASWEPQLFLFAGDTLYPDEDDISGDLPRLREAYDLLEENRQFAAFRSAVPVWPVWDDHDYGRNDGGRDFLFRESAEELFLERWGFGPEDPRTQRPGVYHSVIYGKAGRAVQLIVLDTRYFRSSLRKTDDYGARGKERYVPDPDPAKTLLGDEQWAWLAQEFRRDADLRIIVSSIQVLAEGHGWESWRNLPAEKKRLFELLRKADQTPTLLLSGDRHVAGFYTQDIAGLGPIFEFTSSALNNPVSFPNRYNTLSEAGPNRLGVPFGESNFGGVVIDWERRLLTLELFDAAGSLQRAETLTLEAPMRRLPAWETAAP